MILNADTVAEVLTPGVKEYFGHVPRDVTEILAGGNNRLFRFEAGEVSLMAKVYPRDGRLRLEREFMAVRFFSDRGLKVPRAFFANDAHRFAVYSLEPGRTLEDAEVGRAEIEQMADFILELHAIPVGEVPEEFINADGGFFSYQGYIDLINDRMKIFGAALSEGRMAPQAAEFALEVNAVGLVQDLIARAVAGLSDEAIRRPLDPSQWRLSPIDMGPHNMLFDDGRACFIDLEFAGWDEPMRTIAEFMNHQANRGIKLEVREHFRDYYLSRTTLPQEIVDRWPTDERLMAVIWLTTQLLGMTPERIAMRKFANPELDVDEHVSRCIAKARERIAELT